MKIDYNSFVEYIGNTIQSLYNNFIENSYSNNLQLAYVTTNGSIVLEDGGLENCLLMARNTKSIKGHKASQKKEWKDRNGKKSNSKKNGKKKK